MNKKLSDKEYIAVLEKRDEESRRAIRSLTSMLTSAIDRIEEQQNDRRRRSVKELSFNSIAADDSKTQPLFLDSSDVAELLHISKSTALKFIKGIGGVQVGNRWRLNEIKLDEFISQGMHLDLN